MRRWLSGLMVLALAAGCGDDDDSAGGAGAAGVSGESGQSGQGGAAAGEAGASGTAGAGGEAGAAGTAGGGAGGSAAGGGAGGAGAGGAGGQGPTLEERKAAAEAVATNEPLCQALGDFYWEIGDVSGALASGSTGGKTVQATTTMLIASASKWIFGAYALERAKAEPALLDVEALTMRSGRVSFKSCAGADTVEACANAGNNTKVTPSEVGLFHYGGGHFQAYGVALGIGALGQSGNEDSLGDEVRKALGLALPLGYFSPQLAGGMRGSAASYAAFLRRLLGGELALSSRLGENAVCTLPAACPQASGSPAPLAWHYSYGHWVEDDPTSDGAFSSAGAFGFYPWVTAQRDLYGILARQDTKGAGPDSEDETGSGNASVQCGRLIRRAFVQGAAGGP